MKSAGQTLLPIIYRWKHWKSKDTVAQSRSSSPELSVPAKNPETSDSQPSENWQDQILINEFKQQSILSAFSI